MCEINKDMKDLISEVPGGLAKIALDDKLTLLYATDGFYRLMENATIKVNTENGLELRSMVYSADIIYLTRQLATQRQRKDKRLELHFRILKSNGKLQWIILNGNLTKTVQVIDNKEYPVFACLLTETKELMDMYKRMEQDLSYQHIISELSRDIFFEYEISTDTMTFQPVFREIFGKENTIRNFSSKIENTKLVDPREHPAVIKIYKSIMGGRKQARFELTLTTKEKVAVRYTCYVSIIFDENKNPYRVIGKLATNPMHRGYEPIVIMNPLDDQTNVLSKTMTETMIKEYLSNKSKETTSAVLLVEIRNYKIVNDVMKSLKNENVLKTIASILKSRFLNSDIIGRLGNSEFIIYMDNIKEEQNAYDKIGEFITKIEGLYSFEHIKNGITVSVGIQFIAGDIPDYQSLINNLNTALVLAKLESKSSYVVYQ